MQLLIWFLFASVNANGTFGETIGSLSNNMLCVNINKEKETNSYG